MQNAGELQLSWTIAWPEPYQLAIELFGLWPGFFLLEVSR